MKISIRTMDQKTISLELTDNTQNVLQLKQRLVELPEITKPVETLQLIYSGRIMQDNLPLADYNIMEDKLIVLMSKKNPAEATPQQQQKQERGSEQTLTYQTADPPRSSIAPDEQRVRDLILMGYEEQDVPNALRASINHPDRAIEYLITGIPSNTSKIDQGTDNNATGGDSGDISEIAERLMFLATDPCFAQMRAWVREKPELLELVLTHLSESDPVAFEVIGNHQEEFISMLNGATPLTETFSNEEEAAVERLMELGFDRDVVVTVYLACNKHEELAAEFLLRHTDEEDN